jgi:3-oxoacyl-[acyl-carrier protein] reductase|tara:strand:- start:164 stop:874 length:711 start_codon:yes stop_codon:yes gene_type:complete
MKTVIITGANRGIGLATAKLISNKYKVIGVARKKILNFPGEFYECDLANKIDIERFIRKIKKKNNIYGIVNNAGASFGQSIDKFDLKTFEKSINLNLKAAVHLSKGFVDQMIQNKIGRIVNIASRAALGRENRTSYSAAKSGLYGFSRTWALELAKKNITVNIVSPGPILTELQKKNNNQSSKYKKQFLQQNPMGRFGKPEEVAHAIDFFLSEKSSFITGQALYVCGGMSVGHFPI